MSSSSKKSDEGSNNVLYIVAGAAVAAAVGYYMFAGGSEAKKSKKDSKKQSTGIGSNSKTSKPAGKKTKPVKHIETGSKYGTAYRINQNLITKNFRKRSQATLAFPKAVA